MAMTGSSTSFDFWACNAYGVASRPGHLGLLAAKCPGRGAGTGPHVAGTLRAAAAAVAVPGTVDPEAVVRAGRRTPDAIPSHRRTYPAGALCVCWRFGCGCEWSATQLHNAGARQCSTWKCSTVQNHRQAVTRWAIVQKPAHLSRQVHYGLFGHFSQAIRPRAWCTSTFFFSSSFFACSSFFVASARIIHHPQGVEIP
ncbi:hypothetical protein CCMA1212_004666 [Trichoderma ghanense]|uniref:Uncharacterized protein n=1 Tax=Trichoderma ghanense TaxID=65468 RepID=A0ABY2H7Z4_9HYPO